ncbi:hypothetical protein [Riemerella anatipestifer]|uniref:Uncharacterized protein n=1 Tax=Riemerella anatipestifer TaxID=34085 RepID=A0A1S7DUF8_RIEAN|nr:hypothetical protein [Riemerella anatipestifer]AQY22753.1 hypothetical protein AB406_1812 [Riemerella anatipestifer]MCD5968290.1 hypothetical protein [Riemerella anatipestifer]MCO4304706.1 hypothetical protein [Riemerella anatipestifer]MCO7352048.1 hypothetical protein [Riemerella anatipestifer]MCO7354171.1 hypothetical protein [Riemerella anatipestifer]
MRIRKLIYMVSVLAFVVGKSQQYLPKDTLYGKVKTLREKVIFLTEITTPQFLDYEDDYGHTGFRSAKEVLERFKKVWYTYDFCHYLNYKKVFDNRGNMVKEIWFDKKDTCIASYQRDYDSRNRIIRELDSVQSAVLETRYDYLNDNEVNIIKKNLRTNYARHSYEKIESGKLKVQKIFHSDEAVSEYNYVYDDNGLLKYRVYKNPYSWKQDQYGAWSYGIYGIPPSIYKDIVNYYDSEKRLVKNQKFGLFENDTKNKFPNLYEQTKYYYQKGNLIRVEKKYNSGVKYYEHFSYDEQHQVSIHYCCSKSKNKSSRIGSYKLQNDKIIHLNLIAGENKYDISFDYVFDDKNNWTEITKAVNGIALYKWVRKIEYYE